MQIELVLRKTITLWRDYLANEWTKDQLRVATVRVLSFVHPHSINIVFQLLNHVIIYDWNRSAFLPLGLT
jgi:hypothetical protein